MIIDYKPYLLEFKHPFGVSSNTRTATPTVFVKISTEGESGYGEACLPAYLGETTENTVAFLERAKSVLRTIKYPFSIPQLLEKIDALMPGHNAAKASIDIALHDLFGKMESKACYQVLGIEKSKARETSITIGIDSEEKIEQKIKEASDFSILKIKAGTHDDQQLINTIRKYSDKPLYVDANQGWKNKEQALDLTHWLKDKGVVLIEQPMPVTMLQEMAWLSERSPLPVIADESVKRLDDLVAVKNAFSGVNIKLMKCTGLHEALRMIDFARQNQLKVMLGCMAESSVATSAMAHLMGLADFIDLDAPNLIKNDPFAGISYQFGKLILNDSPGIGLRPLIDLFNGK